MLYVYDNKRKKIGVLENATNIICDENVNKIFFLDFDLPIDDDKNKLCQPFYFVRYTEQGEFYRILPGEVVKDEMGIIHYECEHAITTLADTIMFGWHEVGNLGVYTKDSINYILHRQSNWRLGTCEFSNQFLYGWEQENLLAALFSIATPINTPYMWKFDTRNFPWSVNLVKLPDKNSVNSKDVAMFNKNMLHLNKNAERTSICTRLYPLGYGEGINQLTIKSVNNNVPYIQSPKAITDKYGIVEKVWTDRRYEDVNSLFETAKKMLNELQEPLISYTINVSDIDVELGDIVRIIDDETNTDFKTNVIGITRNYSDDTVSITIANKTSDIAQSISNIADRQRIETTYAQGSTQIYAQSLQVNASSNDGAELNFYIPSEMINVNKVLIKIKKESFRAYSKATVSDGGTYNTTSWKGGEYSSTTTSWEGSQYTSTGVENYQSGRGHNHGIPHHTELFTQDGLGNWRWAGSFNESGDHIHNVQINGHSHEASISIGGHDHSFNIAPHAHEITAGIYRFGGTSSFSLYCNNKFIRSFSNDTSEIDITMNLVNAQNVINRGSWHSVKVVPNNLAYISIDLYLQGFIQSRGGVLV